jgi:transaldolase
LGQSPWYDFITRELMRSGRLARLIEERGLRGMTSNPTIFEKAITGSSDYDAEVARMGGEGRTPGEIFEALAVEDVRAACDAFRPLYDAVGGTDGLVSLEVSPELAHDTAGTIAEATRLWARVDRPNAMIKIPGTLAGLPAITEALATGVSVNVTLLFSVDRYRAVIDAFMSGLERRVRAGQPIGAVTSVASFFVSRVDGRVDSLLDRLGDPRNLRSRIAIANAAAAYRAFQESLQTPRWQRLAEAGGQKQRPLWASTSTKDPRLPDTYYVEALVAADTVNTLPPDTFDAYADHGRPDDSHIQQAMAEAPSRFSDLAASGVNMKDVTTFLEEDGVAKFAASYRQLLAGIASKLEALIAHR